jgi:hypothetical protein
MLRGHQSGGLMRIPLRARPGFASAAVGVLLLAQMAASRILLRATASGVALLGDSLSGECLFRRLTGRPCPTCGMTRSIVLTLNGQIGAAWRVNFAGPAWVLAVSTVAFGLLWLAWRQSSGGADRAVATRRRVRLLAMTQGAVFGALLATHWICAISGLR